MVSFMAVEGSRVGPSLELDLREWVGVSKVEVSGSHALWGLGIGTPQGFVFASRIGCLYFTLGDRARRVPFSCGIR